MSVQERKERERAGRERLILATARELAEQQGWDAVTTRRLAERIEYSQPVLYSHFRGKREIIGAVALEGAAELAVALRAATSAADGPHARVRVANPCSAAQNTSVNSPGWTPSPATSARLSSRAAKASFSGSGVSAFANARPPSSWNMAS